MDTERFIARFHNVSQTNNIDDVFTSGCCYWFAAILCMRFSDAVLMYDPVINHFMAGRHGRLFDITGDVTDQYKHAIPWGQFDDCEERARIESQCIYFTE